MKKRALLASGLAGAAIIAAPAMNMDDPAMAAEWNGFYIGAHVGGLTGDVDLTNVSDATLYFDLSPGGTMQYSPDSVLGGVQLGYNFQMSQWVFGIELSGSGLDFDETQPVPGGDNDIMTLEMEWLATAAARLGFAWDDALLYVKGGYAAGNVKTHQTDTCCAPSTIGFFDTDETHNGFIIGGGGEYAISRDVSIAVEYNYIDLGETDHSAIASGPGGGLVVNNIQPTLHTVTARINWHLYTP